MKYHTTENTIENMLGEVWKQYKDTPYFFSNCGRVKRRYKKGDRLLKPYEHRKKCKRGEYSKQMVKVHRKEVQMSRVIWELFNGEIPNGYRVHHKDNCWFNNDLSNLELLTPKELGLVTGKRNRLARKIIDLDTGKIYKSTRDAEKHLFASRQTINDICNGKRKKPIVNVRWLDGSNKRRTARL